MRCSKCQKRPVLRDGLCRSCWDRTVKGKVPAPRVPAWKAKQQAAQAEQAAVAELAPAVVVKAPKKKGAK